VNLSGQNCHIVIFDEFNPVTWPEVQVLMALHGDENVMDIVPIAIGDLAAAARRSGSRHLRLPHRRAVLPRPLFPHGMMMTDDDKLPRLQSRRSLDQGRAR
jgi:hypothetical protein